MAILRSRGSRTVTSSPPIQMRPASALSRPATTLSKVLLPQPDGPSSTMNSPAATASEMSVSTATAPKLLAMPSMASALIP